MFCSKCGQENDNDNEFCASCGTKLVKEHSDLASADNKAVEKKSDNSAKVLLAIILGLIALLVIVIGIVIALITTNVIESPFSHDVEDADEVSEGDDSENDDSEDVDSEESDSEDDDADSEEQDEEEEVSAGMTNEEAKLLFEDVIGGLANVNYNGSDYSLQGILYENMYLARQDIVKANSGSVWIPAASEVKFGYYDWDGDGVNELFIKTNYDVESSYSKELQATDLLVFKIIDKNIEVVYNRRYPYFNLYEVVEYTGGYVAASYYDDRGSRADSLSGRKLVQFDKWDDADGAYNYLSEIGESPLDKVIEYYNLPSEYWSLDRTIAEADWKKAYAVTLAAIAKDCKGWAECYGGGFYDYIAGIALADIDCNGVPEFIISHNGDGPSFTEIYHIVDGKSKCVNMLYEGSKSMEFSADTECTDIRCDWAGTFQWKNHEEYDGKYLGRASYNGDIVSLLELERTYNAWNNVTNQEYVTSYEYQNYSTGETISFKEAQVGNNRVGTRIKDLPNSTPIANIVDYFAMNSYLNN